MGFRNVELQLHHVRQMSLSVDFLYSKFHSAGYSFDAKMNFKEKLYVHFVSFFL